MTAYLPGDDNPIQETDRMPGHPTNPARSEVDNSNGWSWAPGRASGWTWKTVFDYLLSNAWKDPEAEKSLVMSWQGQWAARQYDPGSVVVDGLWTMVANKTTSDKAGLVLAGSPVWGMDPEPTWATTSPVASQVITGARFNAGDVTDMVIGARAYIPVIDVDVSYRALLTEVFEGDSFRIILDQALYPTLTGWFDIPTQGFVFDQTSTYELLLVTTNSSTTAAFNGRWEFSFGTANVTPGIGGMYFRSSTSQLSVHNIDGNADPQGANLDTVVPGTIIEFAGNATFTVTGVDTPTATVHTFVGNFTGFPPSNWQDVVFNVPTPAATSYVEEVDYWLSNPPGDNATINGLISQDGNEFTVNDTAYGIDLFFDEVVASPDWDVVALSQDLTP